MRRWVEWLRARRRAARSRRALALLDARLREDIGIRWEDAWRALREGGRDR